MNDQNNQSSGQPDLNSILSSHPQPPTDSSLTNSPLTAGSAVGEGLMSPPISASPPASIATQSVAGGPSSDSSSPISLSSISAMPTSSPQTANPFGAPPPPPVSAPPPVDVPQFSASPFTPPLTTQSDPSFPQASSASSGLSGFGTTLESSPPTDANPTPATGTPPPSAEQPQNFNWPKPQVTEPATTPETNQQPTVISPETNVQSNFAPADLSNVQTSQPTQVPTSPLPVSPPMGSPSENTGTNQPETPPTDLSHLVEPTASEQPPLSQGGAVTPSYNPPTTQPESLVVPATLADTTATAQVATAKEGVPKWVIILGVVLLLAVAAASAYFILGVGRSSEPPASAPATTNQQQIVPPPVATTAPTPVATSSAQPVATGSAGFSDVNQQATSAADLLRQRQGR